MRKRGLSNLVLERRWTLIWNRGQTDTDPENMLFYHLGVPYAPPVTPDFPDTQEARWGPICSNL